MENLSVISYTSYWFYEMLFFQNDFSARLQHNLKFDLIRNLFSVFKITTPGEFKLVLSALGRHIERKASTETK